MDPRQQLQKLENDVNVEKQSAIDAWNSFEASEKNNSEDAVKQLRKFYSAVTAMFNNGEILAREILQLPPKVSTQQWVNEYAEDCLSLLDAAIRVHKQLLSKSAKYGLKLATSHSPAAYASAQRVVCKYCPDKMEDLRGKFEDAGLPVRGFDKPKMAKSLTLLGIIWAVICIAAFVTAICESINYPGQAAVAIGVVLVLTLLGLTILYPEPTKFQEYVFRTILALGVAAVGWILLGTISVKLQSGFITSQSTGSFALFCLVYFGNPPALVHKQIYSKNTRR